MKKITFLAIIFMLTIVSVACNRQAEQAAPPQKEVKQQPIQKQAGKVSLRLAWIRDMAEIGIFVADAKGFYKNEGIDLEILPGGSGPPFPLVAPDKGDDFGVGGAGELLKAREQGMKLVAIAAEFQNTPVGFIVREESGIKSFADFTGKRVGVQTGTDTDTLYRALLFKNGIKSETAESSFLKFYYTIVSGFGISTPYIKETPISFNMDLFVADKLDVLPGYVTNQPIILGSMGIKTKVLTAKSQGLNYYGNVYFVKEETLKNDPELVRRFLRATKAGWEYAMANKSETVAIAKKAVYGDKTEISVIEKFYDAVMPFIKPDEQSVSLLGMSKQKWESTQTVLTASGILKAPVDISSAYSAISY